MKCYTRTCVKRSQCVSSIPSNRYFICALFCDSIDDRFPERIVVISSTIAAAERSSNIVHTRQTVSTWSFISRAKFEEELATEEDKSPNVRSVFPRLDFAAHYCSVDWSACLIGKAGEEEASLRNIRQPVTEEKNASACIFQRRNFFLAVRSRGTLNVRIGKKVTRRNSVPRRPQMDIYKDLESKI